MGLFAAVGEGLIKREVRQRKATQRGAVVIAGVDSDRTVEDVDAMPSYSTAQRQERCRCMAEETRFPTVVLIKIHVSRPKQQLGRSLAGMFSMIQPRMNIECIFVFVIERPLAEKS